MLSLCRFALLAAAAALLGGCAAARGPAPQEAGAAPAEARECAQWFEALDERIDAAGVRDAQYARVPGFPYLRTDRFTASFAERAAGDPRLFAALVERMRSLDLESRRFEVENLVPGEGSGLLQRWRYCADTLQAVDLALPQSRERLLEAARVPDDYSIARRVFGLYALTRVPFAMGVRRWEADTREAFARGPAPGSRVRYAPPGNVAIARETVEGLLSRARLDPLGVPELSQRELMLVAAAYAPSFDVQIGGDYDRFGELRWRPGEAVPSVDSTEAVVYVLPAYTRYRGRTLLQLVYTIWFPERPASGPLDLLAGRLDGLVWRVTLAPDGEPLLYDSMHPCGCFHQFFPTPRARPRPAPDGLQEWAFSPQSLPRVSEGERPLVSVASATHYIEGVSLVHGVESLVRYAFRPYDELRSLPRADGTRRSVFGPEGLVRGTERAERLVFWPMGIVSPGAMRQWGRHATAFVGRRHFDDADLVERRFELDLGQPTQKRAG